MNFLIVGLICCTLCAAVEQKRKHATYDANSKLNMQQGKPLPVKEHPPLFPRRSSTKRVPARTDLENMLSEPRKKESVYTVHGPKEETKKQTPTTLSEKSKLGCLTMMKKTNAQKSSQDQMSDKLMESSCEMYMEWGANMRESKKWKPTTGQKTWWDSLSGKHGKRDETHSGTSNGRRRYLRQSGYEKSVRKEYRMMTDYERASFHNAVRSLKQNTMDGINKYDIFVNFHQAHAAPGAHFGPGFYGFHRELLLRFENALREINPTVSIPYWDSNLDSHLGDDLAQQSILWTEDFLGNGKGDVVTGPFAYWSLERPTLGRWILHRNLTVAPPNARTEPALMSDEAVQFIINARSLRQLTWFVDTSFESHHGATHNWVSGVMGDLPNSPADPIFFMHHAFIDCLWEQMRSRQRQRTPFIDPQYDYPNDSVALGVGIVQPDGEILTNLENSHHYVLATMEPFSPLRNINGLSNEYFNLFYTCAPSPRCSANDPDCGSEYLFCDINTYRCAPKLQTDTTCSNFENSDPCYNGHCCKGICKLDICTSDDDSNANIESSSFEFNRRSDFDEDSQDILPRRPANFEQRFRRPRFGERFAPPNQYFPFENDFRRFDRYFRIPFRPV